MCAASDGCDYGPRVDAVLVPRRRITYSGRVSRSSCGGYMTRSACVVAGGSISQDSVNRSDCAEDIWVTNTES